MCGCHLRGSSLSLPTGQADAAQFHNRFTWTQALSSAPTTLTFDTFDAGGAIDLGAHHIKGGVDFAISGGENPGTISGAIRITDSK